MCTTSNKLNRSCSESDLYKANVENSLVKNCNDDFEKTGFFVTKRVFFVEEVIHSGSPDVFRRGAHYQVLGRSTPDCLHNPENLFGYHNPLSISAFNSNISGTFDTRKNDAIHVIQDTDVPMETDTGHAFLKPTDCVDFIETMDVDIDTENDMNNIYDNLKNVMKKRHLSKKPIISTSLSDYISEGSSIENKTKITPVACVKKKRSLYNICILSLVIIFMLASVYIVFFNDFLFINSDVQYQNIQQDLLEKVHGQNASINVIIKNFQQREHWHNKIKVLSFVGSTGVGKTFVANIIKRHFHSDLCHELFGTQLNYESQRSKILYALKSCCLNLIIIDDLNRKDTTDLFGFIHSLPQDKFVLVISIFNIQYSNDKINQKINYTDIIEIRNDFDNSGLQYELIIFREFNDDQVKDWIKKQLQFKNIDSGLQEQILNNVLTGYEIKYNGLKGIYPKLLLELEKHIH